MKRYFILHKNWKIYLHTQIEKGKTLSIINQRYDFILFYDYDYYECYHYYDYYDFITKNIKIKFN